MCGIGGWIGWQDGGGEVAERMRQMLHHRGPDGYGVRSFPSATLVHTRLSIIDLSESGAQPMTNETGTVWSVFNGEIYNYRELRSDLERKGHRFRGNSDSEVIPHLYEELGTGFVERLRGMFAIAIYDAPSQTLILARDRFGIKPLFYAPTKMRLAFASELRAILCVNGIDMRPDRQAVYDYAALFYIPAPETFYRGIRALQAGEILEARLDGSEVVWKTRHYWKGVIAPDQSLSLSKAVNQAEELIAAAVKQQLESDVPLGSLLSGGIDSSLVSTAAQRYLEGELRTFNVRFSDPTYDETWAALAVARRIGSQHVTLDMDDSHGTWKYITDLLRQAGQPFADTSLFAVNTVSRLMRTHVTVALSGDGGDEAFGGYDLYWQLALIASMQRLPLPLRKGLALGLVPLARFGLVHKQLLRRFSELAQADDVSIIQGLFAWVREEEQRRLCLDFDKALPARRLFEPQWEHQLPRDASRVERLSALATEVNVRLVLPNDFLFKVDMGSMRESLEVRVPMLDENLFAFGLTLPHRLKVKGRVSKKVLRGVADQWLPIAVAKKPKWGFGIPVDTWVDSDFKERLRESLLGPSSRLPEFFDPIAYRPILEAFCQDRPCAGISRGGLYGRAIMLLAVQLASEQVCK
ncbi:MAG: asparagine synthase (glutamine-hydrolyzing) [Nitrospira sp. BO4]|jgi:asparagine synthase (glutamine-hydrolysing)|nr:asparagine synthase (glutamine-hydrolyzing) [Nitrospira sp. BO4]